MELKFKLVKDSEGRIRAVALGKLRVLRLDPHAEQNMAIARLLMDRLNGILTLKEVQDFILEANDEQKEGS